MEMGAEFLGEGVWPIAGRHSVECLTALAACDSLIIFSARN